MIPGPIEHLATASGDVLAAIRVQRGAPRGLAIVVHGFPDHPPTFAPLIDALAAHGLEVIAPWLRGYAPSTRTGPFTVDQLGADILSLARAHAGGRPVYLVGHDWGAIATYAALLAAEDAADGARSPIAAAVTLSVPHPLAFVRALGRDGQWRRSWYMAVFQLPGAARLARAGDFALIDRLWRAWSPRYRLPAAERAALHACLAASWPAPLGPYRALVRPLGAVRARLDRARRPLATPILYLHGADDGCIAPGAARDQARWLTDVTAHVLPGAGHFLHCEIPGVIAPLITAFVDRHPQLR